MKKFLLSLIIGATFFSTTFFSCENKDNETVTESLERNTTVENTVTAEKKDLETIAQEIESEVTTESENVSSYQSILEEYSKNLRELTPTLIEKYDTSNSDDFSRAAEEFNAMVNEGYEKIAGLAGIGLDELRASVFTKNENDFSESEKCLIELFGVYTEEYGKLVTAFT